MAMVLLPNEMISTGAARTQGLITHKVILSVYKYSAVHHRHGEASLKLSLWRRTGSDSELCCCLSGKWGELLARTEEFPRHSSSSEFKGCCYIWL